MNKTFFGQNIYRISSSDTTYNIDVTVNYPWTLSGESVEFRLMQATTQLASATKTLEIDIQSDLDNLFPNLSLNPGQYRIQINKTGYNGTVAFTVPENNTSDITVTLNITAVSVQNTMFNLIMSHGSDPETNGFNLYSSDGKGNIQQYVTWAEPDSLPNQMWIPEFSAALIKNNSIGELQFEITIELDGIADNHAPSIYLSNDRDESAGFSGTYPTFTFDTNNFEGSTTFSKFFSDITQLTLNVELNEYYSE